MSAINPIIQTPPRLNPDQFNSGAGQNTAPAAQQGFSDTLNSVGAKPVRKSASGKAQQADGGGDTLPAAGKHSPPAPPGANAAAAGTAGAPVSPVTASPAATSPAAAPAGTAPAANISPSASAAIAASKATGESAIRAADAAAAADTAPPPDPAVGKKDGVSAQDALAAAIDSSGAPESLPGQAGEIPQSTTAKPAALASAATAADPAASVGKGGAAAPGSPAQAPAIKVAANPGDTTPSNWDAGKGAAVMRAIYPTGNSGATSTGQSTVGGQDPGNTSAPDAATTAPAAQVDTAAMIGAMQANSPASTASPADAAPAKPPANPIDNTTAPVVLAGPSSDVPSLLPAMAAAAASAAQVVSTIAAGAAADKKSHDQQTQIASTSAASSSSDAAGAAQLLNSQGTTHTDSGVVPTFKLNAAVDSPEFSQNLAGHVSTMLDGNVNSAKLQVNPPALGPIEVRIAIQGDHAQVWMASHSAMTRDALQDAAPQLREMLNSQGFAQVSVDISQRSFQERSPTAHAYEWNGESNAAANTAPGGTASVTSRTSSGALDAYA